MVRADLKMSCGKTAAQAGHAAVIASDRSPHKKEWMEQGGKKTVLKVGSERELIDVLQNAKDNGLPAALVQDAGHTELTPGTRTCVGIGPAPVDDIDKVTGELKLL